MIRINRWCAIGFLLVAAACGGGGGQRDGVSSELILEAPPSTCLELIDGPTRGLACLHCSEPSAQEQAVQLTDVLLKSCLKNIAVNFLVDGTFEYDERFLAERVASLAQGGRNTTVVLYLVNGFAQRARYTSTIRGFGAGMMPPEFRPRIRSDEAFRDAYRSHVESRAPLVESAIEAGATVIVVPMLEDNLDFVSYEAMLDLTREAIPAHLPVRYGRNPCLGECHVGNDAVLPPGVIIEEHTDDPGRVVPGGIVTNDGYDYEGGRGVTISAGRLKQLRDHTGALNGIFILWSAVRQGISTNVNAQAVPPEERVYPLMDEDTERDVTGFLREGLL